MTGPRFDLGGSSLSRRSLLAGSAGLALALTGHGGSLSHASAFAPANSKDGYLSAFGLFESTFVRNFNPLGPANGGARWLTSYGIYEGLLVWTPTTRKAIPWLAESWEWSKDFLTLTFHLRPGVKWSDGQPFTAKDVEFTWNLFFKHDTISGNGARSLIDPTNPILKSVKAVDELTAAFTFARPFTIGLYDLGSQLIVPEHAWKDVADPSTYANENPVGTGPFTEVTQFEAQVYELSRNPNYWQSPKPYIKGVRVPAITGNDQAVLALLNGELDFGSVFIPDIDKTWASQDKTNFHYWAAPFGGTTHLYLNTQHKPFDDVRVRKAISMALNRQQAQEVAFYNLAKASDTTGLSDGYGDAKNPEAAKAGWCDFNPDEANKLLDEAGLTKKGDVRQGPDGPMEYEFLTVSGWSDWMSAADIFVSNLKDVGIKATITPLEFGAWIDKTHKGTFDMSMGWTWEGQTVWNFYRGVMSGKTYKPAGQETVENWGRVKIDGVDEMLDEFSSSADEAKWKEIGDKLQMIYAENAPALPMFTGSKLSEFSTKRFEGFPSQDDPWAVPTATDWEMGRILTSIYPVGFEGATQDVIAPSGAGASPAASPAGSPAATPKS